MITLLQQGNIPELQKLNTQMNLEQKNEKTNSRNSIIQQLKEINKEEGPNWFPSEELINQFYHESGMSYEDSQNIDPFFNELLNLNAIQIACDNEDINLLQYIFQIGNEYYFSYDTEWTKACQTGNIEIVKILFENKPYELPKIKSPHQNVHKYLQEQNMISN